MGRKDGPARAVEGADVRALARPCPRCGRPALLTAENPARPFCSDRCKKVDLGEWLLESMRIPDTHSVSGTGIDEESGSF